MKYGQIRRRPVQAPFYCDMRSIYIGWSASMDLITRSRWRWIDRFGDIFDILSA
jgi:hypothetical protein